MEDFIAQLKSLDINFISLLRKQLFYIFLDTFDSATLDSNGFPTLSTSEEDAKKHLKWLKKRFNAEYASNDIYDMGISILEGRIFDKLALNLLTKPLTITPTTNTSPTDLPPLESLNVIDNNGKLILQKLTDLVNVTTKIQEENRELDWFSSSPRSCGDSSIKGNQEPHTTVETQHKINNQ